MSSDLATQGQGNLLKQQAEIEAQLKRLRESMQTAVNIEVDEGDTEIFEREKNAALMAVLETKLRDINAALRSIEKGAYGTCERCSQPIEPERLQIKPDATHCVQCQQQVERLSKRGRTPRSVSW